MAAASRKTEAEGRSPSPTPSRDPLYHDWQADDLTGDQLLQALENVRRGQNVFEVVRMNSSDLEVEDRYNRKDKSLSQLSKRFLAEFGLTSNQVISMFEVTDKLSTIS